DQRITTCVHRYANWRRLGCLLRAATTTTAAPTTTASGAAESIDQVLRRHLLLLPATALFARAFGIHRFDDRRDVVGILIDHRNQLRFRRGADVFRAFLAVD